MKYHPSEPRPYRRRGKPQLGRWEVDLRGTLDNGFEVERERRVFPLHPSAGKIGKRQAAAMALDEFQRWNRHGQVLRPGEKPALPQTGAMSPGNAPTLAQFVPDYIELCASPSGPKGGNAPSTIGSKKRIFRVHLLPAFGSYRLDQFHRRDIDRYIIDKTKAKRSYRSITIDIKYLCHLLRVAKNYELITQVPDLPVPPERKSDVIALDPDEAKRFVATCGELPQLRDRVLLEFYLRTGLRAGEAVALYPADFDLDAEHPTVRVSRTYGEGRYGPTKGRNSRVVPVIPALAAKIDELLSEREISPRSTSAHPFSSVFDTSRPLSHTRVHQLVKKTGKAAKTRPLHPHMLRHTFGTECARRGVPLLTIKEWMGHAQVGVTMRYLHLVAPDHLRWAPMLSD